MNTARMSGFAKVVTAGDVPNGIAEAGKGQQPDHHADRAVRVEAGCGGRGVSAIRE
jgi:hypothetical protein